MTLEKTLRHQLNNPEPGGFHVTLAGWDITLLADRQDSLSCSLKELALACNVPIQEELHAWATRLADRVSGLMEPLKVVEIDLPLGKALLRSEAPATRDGKSFYYELLLERTRRTTATLHRYSGDRTGSEKREAVPFVLTHDAVVKLATDIVGKN
jgi:hypothetical protein